ncbi:MAG: PBPRA1643 family SWIM/SEC-C metal-binding motif protein [Motiliproteus sp.]
MSKFFFKGRIDAREKYGSSGYTTKRTSKLGTENNPLSLTVKSDTRKTEIEAILEQHSLFANVEINSDVEESIAELDGVLNTPKTAVVEKTPSRNDPCSCGSGKKYKKCCG